MQIEKSQTIQWQNQKSTANVKTKTAKEYLSEEMQKGNLSLDHSDPMVFYLSVWQVSPCPLPLFVVRILLFLGSIAIIVLSKMNHIEEGNINYWYIYLTHWELVMIALASAMAATVSTICYVYKPIASEIGLPWYVKLFWLSYNVANASAIFVTIFYWAVLYPSKKSPKIPIHVNLSVHAFNSFIMLGQLFSSALPTRLLHFYQPACFAVLYALFNITYYFVGGKNPEGDHRIYQVVDWKSPVKTTALLFGVMMMLIAMHALVAGLAALRNFLARLWVAVQHAGKDNGAT